MSTHLFLVKEPTCRQQRVAEVSIDTWHASAIVQPGTFRSRTQDIRTVPKQDHQFVFL